MRKKFTRNNQYKEPGEHHDIDTAFPDPPFTQATYEAMKKEVVELEKQRIGIAPERRKKLFDMWIVKNGGARFQQEPYGIAVFPETYSRLSKKWHEFRDWAARIEYGQRKRDEQLDQINNQ
jgi:hypothetical protein